MLGRTAVIAAAVCLLAAGCGGGGEAERPQDEVRATLETFKRAAQQKDYPALCDRVFSRDLTDGFSASGLSCEEAMEQAFAAVRSPQLSVDAISVDGERASARVRTSALGQDGSADTVELVRTDDGWRVSSLGQATG